MKKCMENYRKNNTETSIIIREIKSKYLISTNYYHSI